MKYAPPRYLFRRFELLRAVRNGKNFLEIGAGNLELAQELLQHFEAGTLVEMNPGAQRIFDELRPAVQDRLELYSADFFSLELSEKVDCVVFCEVLEHVDREDEFISRVYEVLNPGGQVVLSVPARMKYWTEHDDMVGHLRRYEKGLVEQLFQKHGFRNIRIVSYGFPFANLLGWPRLISARLQQNKLNLQSSDQKTTWSGIDQTSGIPGWVGMISNRTVIYPFALFSSLFNRFDWSDGYLITAVKPE
jgi:SAM-dependent methyltransferase